MRRTATALALSAAVALSACGQVQAGQPRSSASGTPTPVAAVCPADAAPGGNDESLVPLPDSVTPVGVLECDPQTRLVPGDGEWSVMVERRATTGIEAFVAALREPSSDRPNGLACTMELRLVTWFALLDAQGRALRVSVPTDTCGKPQQAAMAALEALRLTTVSETRIRRLRTSAQVASAAAAEALGCGTPWKDEIALGVGGEGLTATAPPVPPAGEPVLVCRYASDSRAADPVGEFLSGTRLGTVASASVRELLAGAAPAAPCSTPHTRFATVWLSPVAVVAVELDGCERALVGSALLQAPPSLVDVLR